MDSRNTKIAGVTDKQVREQFEKYQSIKQGIAKHKLTDMVSVTSYVLLPLVTGLGYQFLNLDEVRLDANVGRVDVQVLPEFKLSFVLKPKDDASWSISKQGILPADVNLVAVVDVLDSGDICVYTQLEGDWRTVIDYVYDQGGSTEDNLKHFGVLYRYLCSKILKQLLHANSHEIEYTVLTNALATRNPETIRALVSHALSEELNNHSEAFDDIVVNSLAETYSNGNDREFNLLAHLWDQYIKDEPADYITNVLQVKQDEDVMQRHYSNNSEDLMVALNDRLASEGIVNVDQRELSALRELKAEIDSGEYVKLEDVKAALTKGGFTREAVQSVQGLGKQKVADKGDTAPNVDEKPITGAGAGEPISPVGSGVNGEEPVTSQGNDRSHIEVPDPAEDEVPKEPLAPNVGGTAGQAGLTGDIYRREVNKRPVVHKRVVRGSNVATTVSGQEATGASSGAGKHAPKKNGNLNDILNRRLNKRS